MYVAIVPNRSSSPAVLLRESYGCLVLYDLTSSYLEGRGCELAHYGYSRDGQRDKLQIVFGLLCAADGAPVAVEVFEGNTGDPATLAIQIEKLRRRFSFRRVVLVGDRGMITDARIEADLKPAGLDWITALRAPAIQALAAQGGLLQPSLFDTRDIGRPKLPPPTILASAWWSVAAPLLPLSAPVSARRFLVAIETELARIQAAVERETRPLRGRDKIGLRIGQLFGRRKMG